MLFIIQYSNLNGYGCQNLQHLNFLIFNSAKYLLILCTLNFLILYEPIPNVALHLGIIIFSLIDSCKLSCNTIQIF